MQSRFDIFGSFDEYIRQGESSQADKAKAWKAAIGMQQVDALEPSAYLIETAQQNIEGYLSFSEVKNRIDSYYQQQDSRNQLDRKQEADTVSARIAEILLEPTFTFSPAEYLSLHRRLFSGLYSFAGQFRKFNISKKEWVLDGASVFYASADSLNDTLKYDFEQEKQFDYRGLSTEQIISHLANFVASLWQIHVFGEGNTRTTAIFFIKYLQQLGFDKANNDLFANHSWFFRNALVRANYENLAKGIYKSDEFLIKFLSNLLLGTDHRLRNREMHIHYFETVNDTVKEENSFQSFAVDTQNQDFFKIPTQQPTSILELIKQNPEITGQEMARILDLSLSTVRRRLRVYKEEGLLERIGSDKTGSWKLNLG